MRRFGLPLLCLACFLGLFLASYEGALLRGRQFGYRDASHYYYPLYERVEQEWRAGRWPLWEPEENAGMPLLGNPTAAVLYPGKVLYRLLPYALGARLYVVVHTVLAFVGMVALLRSWGTSLTGTTLGSLAYAFGAPILFQHCNIIFLVGAGWLPWGMRAIDRWLRLGWRTGLVELAVVLAMQVLGGDVESAYLSGVCAGGYALALARCRDRQASGRWRDGAFAVAGILGAVVWIAGTLILATKAPELRTRHFPPLPLPWMAWVPRMVSAIWGALGLFVLIRWVRNRRRSPLFPMLAGLAGAAVLAAGLAAAQLLPVLEFTGQTDRASSGSIHDIYPYSLEPVRVVELLWPNVFGTYFNGNRMWLAAFPLLIHNPELWVPSLYLGGLTIVLAFSGLGFRDGPPWRGWLTAIAAISLVASFGEFAGPLWWARWDPSLAKMLGEHDPAAVGAIRLDGQLRDGDGGPYWVLATILPGFQRFRYPSKLLSFTTLALAALAGIGWDRMMAGRNRRPTLIAGSLLALSLVAMLSITWQRGPIVSSFEASPAAQSLSVYGPLDAAGAFTKFRTALAHGAVVFAAALLLACRGGRRPATAAAVALLMTTVDLAVANARYVMTVPQSSFDKKSRILELIEAAEREHPSSGPYRIHRMPLWNPLIWTQASSPDRVRHFVEWERDTLQAKYGITQDVHYTTTLGVSELYDYEWFFGAFLLPMDEPMARMLNSTPGKRIIVHPRRGFDLWNTRYFVLPADPGGWTDEFRSFAAFLEDSEPVYPPPGSVSGPERRERYKEWMEREDVQVLRNKNAFPRAWVVHDARSYRSFSGLDRRDREATMAEILFQNDALWHNPARKVYDPRKLAWLEDDQAAELSRFLPGTPPTESEAVTVASYSPQRVELAVNLERPGLVILADVYYPGWRLRIDEKDAPIYRANRMMRGAAVPAGKHRLVYTYEPGSFRVGSRISLGAVVLLLAAGVASWRQP